MKKSEVDNFMLTVNYTSNELLTETIPNIRVYFEAYRIDKKYQGRGYGTSLMSFIKEYIKTIGCRKMFLITNKSNISACRCYEKAGGVYNADDEVIYVYDFREKK